MHAGVIQREFTWYTVIGLTEVGQGTFEQCSNLAMELNECPEKARELIKEMR